MGRILSRLSEVVVSNRSQLAEEDAERRRRLKRRADVQRDAPRFSGATDLDAWWRKMRAYLDEQEVDEPEERVNIAKNALEGSAAEYLGAVEDAPTTMRDLHAVLAKRFGKSRLKKLQEFNQLSQKSGQTLREYYDTL